MRVPFGLWCFVSGLRCRRGYIAESEPRIIGRVGLASRIHKLLDVPDSVAHGFAADRRRGPLEKGLQANSGSAPRPKKTSLGVNCLLHREFLFLSLPGSHGFESRPNLASFFKRYDAGIRLGGSLLRWPIRPHKELFPAEKLDLYATISIGKCDRVSPHLFPLRLPARA